MTLNTKSKRKSSTGKTITRLALGGFMILAAVGHFTFQRKEFQSQVPDWVPMKKDDVVILSGVAEISLGLAMLFSKKYRPEVGLALASFYVAIFPGNIAQYVDQRDAFGLDTDKKRFARLLFQPVLVYLALWSTDGMKLLKEV